MSITVGLETVNPLSYPGWDDLVHASGKGSFFHSSHWARALHESYGYRPVYFASFNGTGLETLVPFMEIDSRITGKRGVSLPFTDYCEPIIPEKRTLSDVIADIIQFGQGAGWQNFELRGGAGMPPGVKPSSSHYGHTLDISRDDKEIFFAFRESTKRNIKKAEREGVKVTISDSLESVRGFYRLNCITRKAHGLPPQPLRFFEELHRQVIAKGMGTTLLANYNGATIAGGVYFHFGDQAVYKYGASDKTHQHLRANNLVMWTAIRYYAAKKFKSFCFGRTEAENCGLLQFKRGWGAGEKTLYYYKYDLKQQSYITESSRLHGFHNKVFANMPIPVLKFAGSLLYKHIG